MTASIPGYGLKNTLINSLHKSKLIIPRLYTHSVCEDTVVDVCVSMLVSVLLLVLNRLVANFN